MPPTKSASKRLIITPGEPAGIGAEILIEALFMGAKRLATIDDPERLAAISTLRRMPIKIKTINTINEASKLDDDVLAVLPIKWQERPVAGKPSLANAPNIIEAIASATKMAKSGLVKGIVTCPIQKSTLYEAGFTEAGHTEYLAKLDDTSASGGGGGEVIPVMMLANQKIRAVPLTIHSPLASVAELITADMIAQKTRIIDMALRRDFGLHNPHIIVAGLNPHAGEGGTIGREEVDIIAPTIAQLAKEGINISGPASADTLFHEDRHNDYDAVLTMYHDQALIPVKTIDFYGSVNITLGLSFIRTSPDHGTALSLAGKGLANPASLIAAINIAEEMAKQRHDHQQ